MTGDSAESTENVSQIEVGDFVKHEPHNGNGFVESRVEAVRDDGTIIAEWRGRDVYELSADEVLDHYGV